MPRSRLVLKINGGRIMYGFSNTFGVQIDTERLYCLAAVRETSEEN